MERRGEFRASQLSGRAGRPHALLDSDRLTLTVSMRMASAQARLKSFAVLFQYGVLCCQSFRIKVFGDLVLPGQRRDLFLVLPDRSATSCDFFLFARLNYSPHGFFFLVAPSSAFPAVGLVFVG